MAHSLGRSLLQKFVRNVKPSHSRKAVAIISQNPCNDFSTSSVPCSEKYDEAYRRSLFNPEEFWAEAAEDITWFKKYDKVLDNSNPPFSKWFVGGSMNTCYNAVDVHVDQGFGNETAIIYDSPVTGKKQTFTYLEIQKQAAKFARALLNSGVNKGDRVIIYMPMIPEALIAIYGCSRIGAVHSVVFGGFAPLELARRIDDSQPKVIVTATCGIEPGKTIPYQPMVNEAVRLAKHSPERIVIVDRPQLPISRDSDRTMTWDEAMIGAKPHDCVPVDANDPLYILYTSGTTGAPKGIQRPNAGHAVALKWSMSNLYDIAPGETWWAASDIGWVVGHSYIVYAPLFKRCPSILFEGKPIGNPDASTFFRIIDEYGVAAMFTAPTALRVIRNEDEDGKYAQKYPMEKFRTLLLAGENADNAILEWSKQVFRTPVVDHWWQTETGWAITNHHLGLGLPADYPFGSCGKPTPGFNVKVLDENHEECERGMLGRVAVKLPLPPGTMSTLWNNDERFVESYFKECPGYYDTSDAGIIDQNGYLRIEGRLDDVINVAGHRLSTKEMERAVAKHPSVLEQAVIGIADATKGVVPVALIVLAKGHVKSENEICTDVMQLVRTDIGPVASLKKVVVLPALPKTRAGKFLRGHMKKILDGENYVIPQTVENIDVFYTVEKILKAQK